MTPSISKIKFPNETHIGILFIVLVVYSPVEIGAQKITDFAIKMPDCETSELESIEIATYGTDFSSESDLSSPAESSESETNSDRQQ